MAYQPRPNPVIPSFGNYNDKRSRKFSDGPHKPEQPFPLYGQQIHGSRLPGTLNTGNTNTLQQPSFGDHRDRMTVKQGPSAPVPQDSGLGLGGIVTSPLLAYQGLKGLKEGGEWAGQKLGLLDTNSQAIDKMGLTTDPRFAPEQFGPASGDVPHTELGQDLTASNGLNLGNAPPEVGYNIQQGFNAPAPEGMIGPGAPIEDVTDSGAYLSDAADATNGLDLAASTTPVTDTASMLSSDTIGGLTEQMASNLPTEAVGEVGTQLVEKAGEVIAEKAAGTVTETAATALAEKAAMAVPFVNVLMAGYKAYKTADRLASGEDPAKVMTSLATLGISDFFWS